MRKHLLCIHKRISCVYTRDLLCMHTLVHALGQGPQGPGTQKRRWAGPRPCFFGSLAPGVPGPEHAQECCACTRDLLCIHKRFFCVYTINVFSYYHIILLYHYIILLYYYMTILLYYYKMISLY